eukprot:472792_1
MSTATIETILALTCVMEVGYLFYSTNDMYMSITVPLTAMLIMVNLYHGGIIPIGFLMSPIVITYICFKGTVDVQNWIMVTCCSNSFWFIISIVAV